MLRIPFFLCLFAVLFPFRVLAQTQFLDEFSSTDLLPHWQGDRSLFQIHPSGQLQLADTASGTAWLYAYAPSGDSSCWHIDFSLDFSPSHSNRLTLYLGVDQPHTPPQGNAYYIVLGESGEDHFRFFRQIQGQAVELWSSPGGIAQGPVYCQMEVCRNGGNWRLSATDASAGQWSWEGTFQDTLLTNLSWFGVHSRYSSTRADKFFWDRIHIAPLYPDVAPPEPVEVNLAMGNRLRLRFDERVDTQSLSTAFELSGGGQVSSVSAGNDGREVFLHVAGLQSGADYTLSIKGVADQRGNAMVEPRELTFTWYPLRRPEPYELIIHEIFADPDPSRTTLPSVEWIELYNRSHAAFPLGGIRLEDASMSVFLPDTLILPGAFVLVCPPEGKEALDIYGTVVPVPGFPTLNNSADELYLRDSSGQWLHGVAYTEDWYRAPQQKGGGYSLELIDTRLLCREATAWGGSRHPSGATPAAPNSWAEPDTLGPSAQLLQVFPHSDQEIDLYFEEQLEASAFQRTLYTLGEIPVEEVLSLGDRRDALRLELAQPLDTGHLYELRVSGDLKNCLGQSKGREQVLPLAIPEQINPGDVLFNELMYEPDEEGVEFIELYNASSKVLNPSGLWVARGESGEWNEQRLISADYLLMPHAYLVLTEEPERLKQAHACEDPTAVLLTELPTLPNEGADLALWNMSPGDSTAVAIDQVTYNPDMHHPLLDFTRGVSLERLSVAAPSEGPSNWHSAAQSEGFATPTGPNSQALSEMHIPGEDAFFLGETVFSPNSDGYRDILPILYTLDAPGYRVDVSVFDRWGRLQRQLYRHFALAREGQLLWDGTTDAGSPAPSGIYVLFIEAFEPGGGRVQKKLACVLLNTRGE